MSSEDVRTALLSKGYFPKELPSVFTTEDFGRHSKAILTEWEANRVFKVLPKLGKVNGRSRANAYSYQVTAAEQEVISTPKKGYERRNVHLTHPVPQAFLAKELALNWRAVQKWLSKQMFSEDEIRVGLSYDRAIKGINFRLHRAKKGYIEATSDWLVRTDISRFYPSIYTHSLVWAAYGKERVKENLNRYNGSLADRLDALVRACNRNQTVGIPIGPETSRILAEIVSSRINYKFHELCPAKMPRIIDRLQDDWFVGCETLEEAEQVLSYISAVYRHYGLEINGSKTSIEHILASPKTTWVSEIGAFLSHRPHELRGARLREFFSMVLRLQTAFPSEPVINYALSIVEARSTAKHDVQELESLLLKAAATAPNATDRICRILLNMQHQTGRVSRERVAHRFIVLAERALERGHIFEVIWLVYTLRGLKYPLQSKTICDAVETLPSSALCLILLDMDSKGLFLRRLPKSEWERGITEDRIQGDWIWLLAYEGFRHGWLRDSKSLMGGALFKPMADRKVVFYDPKKSTLTSANVAKRRSAKRRRENRETSRLIELLRRLQTPFRWEEYE